ncbi:hypothetical protein GCM10022239_08280 [Leifsonia bigeumensis]|uniref:Zinc ribbon domain-containing protein n=1 Tax=Leifsonella bigeumensis TaxID=433643 RepID=A0ABP7FFK1_9MICO
MEALDGTDGRESMPPEGFTSAGDPVCWLEQVCDECGALIEAALPATCWRCGATLLPS